MENIAILQALHADLADYVTAQKGELAISGTYVETLDLLSAKPSGFLCVMEWLGEENPDEQGISGVMSQEVGIYVAINPGLPAQRGQALWASPGGKTLLSHLNRIRDRVREIRLPDDEETDREFNYRECRQVVTPSGIPLRAYRLLFKLFNAIKDPDYRNVNP